MTSNITLTPRAMAWLRELVEFGLSVYTVRDGFARWNGTSTQQAYFFPRDVRIELIRQRLIASDHVGWPLRVTPAGRKAVKA